MSAIRERILQQIAGTTLAGTPLVGGRIYRSRVEPLSRGEAPAIVVSPGPDRPDIPGSTHERTDHRLAVAIAVYVRGAVPDQIADPICAEVHLRMMADRSLGGIATDVIYQGWTPEIEEGDTQAGWMVAEYQVLYRTRVHSLSE
jgi:hypothetical protein